MRFARRAARQFIRDGGVGGPGWRDRARAVHQNFVARRLSPGGSADLLAMTLFVDACERRLTMASAILLALAPIFFVLALGYARRAVMVSSRTTMSTASTLWS